MDWIVQGLKPMSQREEELRDLQIFEEAIRISKKIDAIDFKNYGAQLIM